MAFSETVLAAMIGAAATIGTALFQLFSSLKARAKVDTRSRGVSFRSLVAIAALMLACGFGGFAYSEWRIEKDNTQTLRRELMEQLQALQASTAKLESMRASQMNPPGDSAQPDREAATHAASTATAVELPPCQTPHVEAATQSHSPDAATPQMAASATDTAT